MKKSAKGCIALYRSDEGWTFEDGVTHEEALACDAPVVFEDGELLVDDDLAAIRKRVADSVALWREDNLAAEMTGDEGSYCPLFR